MGYVLDSTFLVDLLRSDPSAMRKARELDARREPKLLATPALYEVMAGLLYKRSRSEAARFRSLASRFALVAFDEPAATRAAEIRAELLRLGRPKGAVDVMLAGTASAGGHTLVSRDRDFGEIAESVDLSAESY